MKFVKYKNNNIGKKYSKVYQLFKEIYILLKYPYDFGTHGSIKNLYKNTLVNILNLVSVITHIISKDLLNCSLW